MKKFNFGSRLLAVVLLLAMLLPMTPIKASAAYYYEIEIGDIAGEYIGDDGVTYDHTGKTGLTGNIDTTDTISWPIRIYDYLNDGMLFEYSNANYSGDIPDGQGGAYGGGAPAPQFTGAQNILGTDYTVDWGYGENAYLYWLKDRSPFEYSKALVEAVNFQSPSHLHMVLAGSYSDALPWVMSDFVLDNSTSYSKDRVRYAVIAYRTSGLEEDKAWINLGWNTNVTGSQTQYGYTVDYRGSVPIVANDTKWNYVIVDMKAGDLATKWNSITAVNRVYIDFGMTDTAEYVDISHVAYFSTYFEAEQFGMDCVAFDNNPGEFLDAHTEYTSESTTVTTPVANPSFTYGADYTNAASIKDPSYTEMILTKSQQTYTNSNGTSRYYIRVGDSDSVRDYSTVASWDSEGVSATLSNVRYAVIVYRTNGLNASQNKIAFYLKGTTSGSWAYGSGWWADQSFTVSNGTWTYGVYDMADSSAGATSAYSYNYKNDIAENYSSVGSIAKVGIYFPGFTSSSQSMDISHICFFSTKSAAEAFGKQALAYVEGETTTTTVTGSSFGTKEKKWNTGNNVAFSMLYANQGGGWGDVAGGTSTQENGYFSYQIGASAWSSDSANETNSDRQTAKTNGYTVADDIFLLNSWQMASKTTGYYDMQNLDLSYTLFNKLYSGVMTAGLLESSIITVTANGKTYRVPDYKEETIEYIAYLLRSSLCVGRTDSSGNYNYNFVQGTANGAQYGYDGNGNPYDLASALRAELGIVLPANGNCTSGYVEVGDYASMTDEQKAALIGPYMSCKDNINTFVDAAYYLLMNLYIDNSYNQAQDEYKYLVLSSGELENGKTAYVFDGGFTTGNVAESANTDAYRNSSQSATVYDKTTQSIYQSAATSKDKVYFAGSTTTTRFPFLPVTDSEGVYAGETKSPYFLDDGLGVMGVTEEGATFVNRNYNYAIASNGEFIYYEEDALFFDFEGDDDVYLFINGELVVDVGAAHSVTTVTMNVNDYVNWAKGVMATLSGYDPNMTNKQLETLLSNTSGLTEEQKDEYRRAHRLYLQDGEICQFDFYYMERHGWGANCRIASNIRVTEPAMRVEKSAYQGGDEIAYSDVIVASDPVEYNFKMINNGSSKLFNLTFTDSTIGVTLDYTHGLTVANGFNGNYVFDANGGTLEASDITALVTGWMPVETGGTHIKDIDGNYVENPNGTHVYVAVENSFKSQQELINFLASLQGEGMDNTVLDTSHLQSGYGLWVDADVTIKGIYYKLSVDQVKAGVLDNTVYVTATSMPNPSAAGNELLQSQAHHRVYVSGLPYYYQWAGHNLYLPIADIMTDAVDAASDTGNQLHEYENFLENMGSNYKYTLCDKHGKVTTYPDLVSPYSSGYLVNYPDAGTHSFYILVYPSTVTGTVASISDLAKGQYAIVRVTVFVTDVEDSYYVLDYGLTTEDLGTNGELFKNDELLGASSNNDAKMMGIATTAPDYLDYKTNTTNYNRIDFSAIKDNTTIKMADGHYTLNISNGKDISFNAYTGQYSLNEVGTVKVNVYTPVDWDNAYLYFWYDGGRDNGWPGATMEKLTAGQYSIDVPADVAHVIVSNGTVQTGNLMITPGMENTIVVDGTIAEETENIVEASVETFVPISVKVTNIPDDWGDVYIYSFNSATNNENGPWPGFVMDEQADGSYTHDVPGSYDRVIINNGNRNGKQTIDMRVTPGADLNIDLLQKTDGLSDVSITVPDSWGDVYLYCWNEASGTNNKVWPGVQLTDDDGDGIYEATGLSGDFDRMIVNNNNGTQTGNLEVTGGNYIAIDVRAADNVSVSCQPYSAKVEAFSSVTEMYTIYIDAPDSWETVNLYAWNTNGYYVTDWPGTKVTKGSDGRYSLQIPVDTAYIIVNNGSEQTIDLSVKQGVEATITLTNPGADGKYLASIDYNDDFTFTPSDFMDETYSIWMAITVHNTSLQNPTGLGKTIDVSQEVQMYKKISVLPATVVYYEDDFPAITYNAGTGNVFTEIGSSSDLTQSVDQEQEYGQDDAYQNNSDMSGNSIHVIDIKNTNVVASFNFTGTGFELIGRTNADDSATILVEVVDSSDTVIKRIPVITQFDNNETGKTPGGDEEIYQVPVIRVDGLTKAQYTVRIKGIPSASREHTYLYLDGIRVFQPLGPTNDHYNEAEDNATFTEIRDLIVTGKAAVAKYDGNSMSVSSGTITWTENLTGKDITGLVAFEGNQVDSVDAYLIKGPNNEVYMNGSVENAALVFTVKPTDTGTPALQIAVRAIDEAQFYVGSTAAPTDAVSGMNAVIEFYAKQSDGSFAWEPLVTVTSGTEQYYSIDLNRCYTVDGKILVAVRVNSGMASFSTLKYNHLSVEATTGATITTHYYINGELAVCSCETKCSSKDDAVKTACPICCLDYTKCEIANNETVETDEIEEEETGIPLAYLTFVMRSPSLSDTTIVPEPDEQPETETDDPTETVPEEKPEQDPGTQPEVDSGVQPENKPESKPETKPNQNSNSKPSNNNSGNKPSASDIAAEIAKHITAIQSEITSMRNKVKGFVGTIDELFR